MNLEQLKNYVVIPVLEKLDLFSPEAVSMLLGTIATESLSGNYIRQVGGPACGIYQMEPATATDILENFLSYRPEIAMKVRSLYISRLSLEENLTMNLAWSTAMCRIYYYRVKEPIPKTFEERAVYWKKYYNTSKGKGFVYDYLTKAKNVG